MAAKLPTLMRRALKASGKSRERVAEECGVTPTAVYYWTEGKRTPSTASLHRFVEVCGLSMAEFYGGREAA